MRQKKNQEMCKKKDGETALPISTALRVSVCFAIFEKPPGVVYPPSPVGARVNVGEKYLHDILQPFLRTGSSYNQRQDPNEI